MKRSVVRSMILAAVVALVATPTAGFSAGTQTGSPLPAAALCPALLTQSYVKEIGAYAITLSDSEPTVADLDVTLFTTKSAYALHLSNVGFTAKTTLDYAPFRNVPIAVAASSDGPYDGFTIAVHTAGATCPLLAAGLRQRSVSDVRVTSNAADREFEANLKADEETATIYHPAPILAPPFACAKPWVGVRVLSQAEPEYPALAAARRASGRVAIQIFLDPSGGVIRTRTYQSSGSPDLDDAADDAARRSTYSPDIAACMFVPSAYLFVVDFSP